MKNIEFEKQARTAFDKQVASLDSQTLHQLRSAREVALSKQKQSIFSVKWLTGAGAGLALAGVLGFMIVPNLMQTNALSPLDDIEILTADADLDLVTQLEFYQWIEASSLSESTL